MWYTKYIAWMYVCIILITSHIQSLPPEQEDPILAIHQAAQNFDTETIKQYVHDGYSLNTTWLNGFLPIHTALLQIIIDNDAKPRDHISKKKLKFLKTLIQFGAQPLSFITTRDYEHPLLSTPQHIIPLTTKERFNGINCHLLCNHLPNGSHIEKILIGTWNGTAPFKTKGLYYRKDLVFDAIIDDQLHQQDVLAHSGNPCTYAAATEYVTSSPEWYVPARTEAEHYSSIHLAVHHGAVRSLQFLLDFHTIAPNHVLAADKKGRTPLDLIIEYICSPPGDALLNQYKHAENPIAMYRTHLIDCAKLLLRHISHEEREKHDFERKIQLNQEAYVSQTIQTWCRMLIEAVNTTPQQIPTFSDDSLDEQSFEPPRQRRRMSTRRRWETTHWPHTSFDDDENDSPLTDDPWSPATFTDDSRNEDLHRGADTLTRFAPRDLHRLLTVRSLQRSDESSENQSSISQLTSDGPSEDPDGTPLWASYDVNRLDEEHL